MAEDCGLPAQDRGRSFEAAFKKAFRRHLRERHRLTHAHERPSMTSRIIDLSGAKWNGDKAEAAKQLVTLIGTILPRLIEASGKATGKPLETVEDVEALHASYAEQEARRMLKLVGEALLGTVGYLGTAAGRDETRDGQASR